MPDTTQAGRLTLGELVDRLGALAADCRESHPVLSRVLTAHQNRYRERARAADTEPRD